MGRSLGDAMERISDRKCSGGHGSATTTTQESGNWLLDTAPTVRLIKIPGTNIWICPQILRIFMTIYVVALTGPEYFVGSVEKDMVRLSIQGFLLKNVSHVLKKMQSITGFSTC